ncbi:MAG: SMC-Scp complex subunit ScpB, partial [Elusimicrobiaceae bacterium]|nr:SMC-Scp complex subunit ScpB [Elusimicrobiaceae bacterium]
EETTPVASDTQDAQTLELLQREDLKQIVETLLFITDRPVKPSRLADVIENTDGRKIREIILTLKDEYAARGSAVQIVEIGGGFQMCTKPEYGRWVRRLYNEKMTTRLSNAALETLAIVAYKQPITRAEMEAIRGVDVAGPLEKLLDRGLVRVVGKKDTIGRPMVYGTTDEFLRTFGLNKISELPDLQVFAAKSLQEKQEDLPFAEPLPPVGEPAIIPLEQLEGEEKFQALDESGADPFFTRMSYNKGDVFAQLDDVTEQSSSHEGFAAETEPLQNASSLEETASEGTPADTSVEQSAEEEQK